MGQTARPMFSPDDTVVGIATPPGRGGIGVVRISGPDAAAIATRLRRGREPLVPRHATFARVDLGRGTADQVILTSFPGPHSYTGEDVVEISAHGSPVLLRAIAEAAMACGARLAEPGEFTFRAFLRGRIDLIQAEAVRDLIDAVTPLQARAAFDQLEGTLTSRIREIDSDLFDLAARLEASLDFPEEGYHFLERVGAADAIADLVRKLDRLLTAASRGRLIREGAQVVIAGRPNAGKSSLFNALADAGRAIVTDIPGTTRDLLTETVEIGGVPMTLVDTAGVRSSSVDPVEVEGIARAAAAREVAGIILVVLDRSLPLTQDDERLLAETRERRRVVVANKSDLPAAWSDEVPGARTLAVSATRGDGMAALRAALIDALADGRPAGDVPAVTNVRHADLLARARQALVRAEAAARAGTPEEFVLADITEARVHLEEVTGARTADDVLTAIFSKFCIGK
jgi:tRNA modification GTPase